MDAKFKTGNRVLYNNEEDTITVSKKNFSTGKISYRLKSNGLVVNESELSPIPIPVIEEKKPVIDPIEEKKKQEPIEEKKPVIDPAQKKAEYDMLNALSKKELIAFIGMKQLDIDPVDYNTKADLLKAVCEELEIVIPE